MRSILKHQFNPADKYGYWTISKTNTTMREVHVVCTCGYTAVVSGYDLLNGTTKGCKPCSLARQRANKKEKPKKEPVNRTIHGCATPGKQTVEYKVWDAINQRCNNPNAQAYRNYGGRGIKLCPEWTGPGGFVKFLAHVGKRPSPDLSLDRIDNEKGYEPGNTRWVNRKTQTRNRRGNINIEIDGITRNLAEWAELYDLSYHCLWRRLRYGMNPKLAIVTPSKNRKGTKK